MDVLDRHLNNFIAKLDLIGEFCYLNHGTGIQPPPAVNYLCQYMGKKSDKGGIIDLFKIPICKECVDALYDERWLLFYCLNCDSSQWLLKSEAKKLYSKQESIRFLRKCPICSECPINTE